MYDFSPTCDPEAIKRMAKWNARALGEKLIIPKALAANLREIGAWDDESMHELQDLPGL
jgi:hypothetical protein